MGEKKGLTEDAKRGDSWAINPYDGIVVGHDEGYPPDLENDCYDEARLRKLQDRAAIERLRDSIIANGGLIQPVVVKKKKRKDGGEYLAVNAGRRRTIACREAYEILKKQGIVFRMQVIVVDRNEEASKTFGRTIDENANRENNSPTEMARDFARFVTFRGETTDRISKETMAEARARFGVDESTLRNWLVLLGLSAKVQHLVDGGALPQNIARELKDFPPAEQEAKALEYAKKLQEEGKGANLLQLARFEKQVAKGKANRDTQDIGLSRGTMLAILKLVEEDEKKGIECTIPEASLHAFMVATGQKKPDTLKGVRGYLTRIEKARKERLEKKTKGGKGALAAAE